METKSEKMKRAAQFKSECVMAYRAQGGLFSTDEVTGLKVPTPAQEWLYALVEKEVRTANKRATRLPEESASIVGIRI